MRAQSTPHFYTNPYLRIFHQTPLFFLSFPFFIFSNTINLFESSYICTYHPCCYGLTHFLHLLSSLHDYLLLFIGVKYAILHLKCSSLRCRRSRDFDFDTYRLSLARIAATPVMLLPMSINVESVQLRTDTQDAILHGAYCARMTALVEGPPHNP